MASSRARWPGPIGDDDNVSYRTQSTNDAGLYLKMLLPAGGTHTIGGLVWLDRLADGREPDSTPPDTADPGIANQTVTVTWLDAEGQGHELALGTRTTGPDGRWLMTNVPTGNIRVALTGPQATNLTVTADPDGTLDGITAQRHGR